MEFLANLFWTPDYYGKLSVIFVRKAPQFCSDYYGKWGKDYNLLNPMSSKWYGIIGPLMDNEVTISGQKSHLFGIML